MRTTIPNAKIGERLVVTASVGRSLSAGSFVVHDADLPAEGLLVLVREPRPVRPLVLVTVEGTVNLFQHHDFPDLQLGDASLYLAYEGRKSLLATRVHVWAAATG